MHLISASERQRGLWGLRWISFARECTPVFVSVERNVCNQYLPPWKSKERALISQSCLHASAKMSPVSSLSHEKNLLQPRARTKKKSAWGYGAPAIILAPLSGTLSRTASREGIFCSGFDSRSILGQWQAREVEARAVRLSRGC